MLKQAIALAPNYGAAYNELGVAYCGLKRNAEAISAFTEALRCDPHETHFVVNLGAAYFLAGRYAEAVELMERATGNDPTSAVAQNNLGQAYLRIGRYERAVECISRAQQMAGSKEQIEEAEIENNLGFANAQLKRYRVALDHLARAIDLKPQFSAAIFNLGMVHLAMNDREAALEQYAVLKTLDPDFAARLLAKIYQGRVIAVSTEH